MQLSLDCYQGAVLFSAVGDALGWPTEHNYIHENRGLKPFYTTPVQHFVAWSRRLGNDGEEIMRPGEYSDDTQLTLAVARCIDQTGAFLPDRFASIELPLWLHYERGGGRTLKAAARTHLQPRVTWQQNFFSEAGHNYVQAGANGAAMRNLPVALANAGDERAILLHSLLNTITTHGHPRAILGALLYGLAVNYALAAHQQSLSAHTLLEYLYTHLQATRPLIEEYAPLATWVQSWNIHSRYPFWQIFQETQQEATRYLQGISHYDTHLDYYKFIGARHPMTKGSGLSTACAAIYLFLRSLDTPEQALVTAVNTFGSDTDTIGTMLGALLGAYYGIHALPQPLLNSVQDHKALQQAASRLYMIATHQAKAEYQDSLDRQLVLRWDTHKFIPLLTAPPSPGTSIIHPTLGEGTILESSRHKMNNSHVFVVVRVQFTSGQSCCFSSEIDQHGQVLASLSRYLQKEA